jgi:16S rRNA (adenine1518-N6/adenine1519-N6)-dimethyltransferase
MVETYGTQRGTGLIPSVNYDSPADLRRFLDERGFGMQKKFGQNFLVNRAARERLVDSLEAESGSSVWEVGPGLGAMTELMLDKELTLTAFEIDRGFAAVLRELFGDRPHFRLVEGDALKTWPAEARASGVPRYFFGNLPYNIAATLIASFIEADVFFDRSVVTVQKEVAKRMSAKAGDEDYSSFSVLCASAYTVRPLMTLKPHSFYPAPNVDSQAVVMDRRRLELPPEVLRVFRPLVRALFSSRRKTVRNNLEAFLSSGERASAALAAAGIDPDLRAERLDLEGFAGLAREVYGMAAAAGKGAPR